MPRFHFHFRQDGRLEEDTIGIEFPTVEAAYLSAFEAARDIWRDLLCERKDPTSCYFEVWDGDNQRLFELPFSEVLDVCKRPTRPPPQHHHNDLQQISEPPPGQRFRDVLSQLAATRNDTRQTRHDVRLEIHKARVALAESNRLLRLLGQY